MEILIVIVLIVAIVLFGVYTNEVNKKKLEEHVKNGDIEEEAYKNI